MIETKLNGKTPDIAEENVKKLKEIFPDVCCEGKIDFEKLQQVLGNYIEDEKERYNFTWNGKGRALRLAQSSSTGTLRPCKEESKNWDSTENLYIEGDNLEVLKLLQKSYHGKIKMIYIDPPYNTGHDFVYHDDYRDNMQNYLEMTGQVDGEGKKISTNSEASGRYHTDWLNMMYPRLRLAKNLLSDDGVIFISIDDNEQSNLRKLCDELFNEDNFIAQVVWERAFAPVNLKKHFSENHDYIVCYAKNIEEAICNGLTRTVETNGRYSNPDNDPRGPWMSSDMTVGPVVQEKLYDIYTADGTVLKPASGRCWLFTKERFEELKKDNRIWFGEDGNNMPRVKKFLTEVKQGITPMTIWKYTEVGHSQDAAKKLKDLFGGQSYFEYPKSIDLIKRCIMLYTNKNDIILDFFSGSATTAHAVMQLNAEDGGNRKFICVQLPEPTDEKSEAYKAGYKNICEIGKERIRRAGDRIIADLNPQSNQMSLDDAENKRDLDIGFKVFKLDTSNIKKWQPQPDADMQDIESTIDSMVDNLVEGRSELDFVYEIMLKYGIDLTYPIEEISCGGIKLYSIGYGMLMICMAENVTTDIAREIVKYKKENEIEEMRVVFKDSSFKDDSAKTSVKAALRDGGIAEFVTI